MSYTKTNWKARQGSNLNKFTKSQETANSVILVNNPDTVIEDGTPFSVENMNHIEEGIAEAHEGVGQAQEGVTQANESITQMQEEITQVQEGAEQTNESITQMQGEINQAQGGVTQANENIAQMQDAITQVQEDVNRANESITQMQEGIDGDNNVILNALSKKAPLASPALTGTPTAPTTAANTNNEQIATTAYADNAGHPVGSYYTQYPVTGEATIEGMFPEEESPAELFGGTWTDMYTSEDVFFRTGALGVGRGRTGTSGVLSDTWGSVGTVGVQPDAIREIFGGFQVGGHNNSNSEIRYPFGVFYHDEYIYQGVLAASGGALLGMSPAFGFRFSSSRYVPTDTTNHPKNRLIKVWKRTA